MPRLQPDLARRTITMETQRRSIDIPVDAAGHLRRTAPGSTLETRAADDGTVVGVRGYALKFGKRTWIGSKRWGFWEQIEPGATQKTITEKNTVNADIVLNRDHDNRLLLARTSNATLRLAEDNVGLTYDGDMGDYSYARDVQVGLQRRDLTGSSFAFDVLTYEWSIADDGEDLLTLRELELFDVAIVGMPAYADTEASLRADFLAAARAHGIDDNGIGVLARRLADPDTELIEMMRSVARLDPPTRSAPAETTRDDSAPAETTRDESQPAEPTGARNAHPLALATLAQRMALIEGV